MRELTALEMAVGTALAHQVCPDRAEVLIAQLRAAKVTDRRFTGVGFFTKFTVGRHLKPVLVAASPDGWVESLVGPDAYQLQFMIYVRAGYAETIEAFSFGDGYGELDLLTAEFTRPTTVTAVKRSENDGPFH